jgi:hypothetical protein
MTNDDEADYTAPRPIHASAHHGAHVPDVSLDPEYMRKGWRAARVGLTFGVASFLLNLVGSPWSWLSLPVSFYAGWNIGTGLFRGRRALDRRMFMTAAWGGIFATVAVLVLVGVRVIVWLGL